MDGRDFYDRRSKMYVTVTYKIADKHTNLTDFLRSLDNVQIPTFTLVVVKKTGEVVDLGILFMHSIFLSKELVVEHVFTSDIPGEVEKYKINARDILNIRSEIPGSRSLILIIIIFVAMAALPFPVL